MKTYILLFAIILTLTSCGSKSSNPADSGNNGNATYFVDWNVDNQHYRVTSDISTLGAYNNNGILAIYGRPMGNSSYPQFILGLNKVTGTGTYTWTANNNNSYSMSWLPTSNGMDFYSVNALASESASSITITEFSTTAVGGSFTGKLAKMVINGADITYSYVSINGTFRIPRVK